MRCRAYHRWRVSTARARSIQDALRPLVVRHGDLPEPRLVAGADVSYSEQTREAYAAVVVLSLPSLTTVELATAAAPARFPYVPGLLSFREAPALLRAFRRVRSSPDAVIFDAQGYAHPRRLGLACHVGLILDLPAVGCAKSRLIGEHTEPGRKAGQCAPLFDNGELIGSVLRTKTNVRPLYVSVGHRLSLEAARRLVLRCVTRYRLPEPTRQAHLAVSKLRQEKQQET